MTDVAKRLARSRCNSLEPEAIATEASGFLDIISPLFCSRFEACGFPDLDEETEQRKKIAKSAILEKLITWSERETKTNHLVQFRFLDVRHPD